MQLQVIFSLAFFPLAKKELVPLPSDGCFLVRAGEPLAWSWCSAAEGQNYPAHRGLPSPCSNLNYSPSPSSCCIVSHVHGRQLQPRKEPSFTSWLKKSQSALELGQAWGWLLSTHLPRGTEMEEGHTLPLEIQHPFQTVQPKRSKSLLSSKRQSFYETS